MKLILKGGGCENMNAQYSVPTELPHLGRADRTLEGVRKCILHAVWQAQGKGCAPGAVGVCIGGDRTAGYVHAKEQLFRTLDDVNPDSRLADLEAEVMRTVNTLGVGTMGFGGRVSLIGCKVGALNRLPASFFVSVAYDCWAFRRLGVVLDGRDATITRWLYRDPAVATVPMMDQAGFRRTGREVALTTPLDEATIRSLKVGDVVMLSGRAYTGRDAVHHHLVSHPPPVDLRGGVIYHCGPVVVKDADGWRVTAAGPTTSIREEPYQGDIIRKYGVRAVMGKGGMGAKTLAALKDAGAVYLNAIGGAAQFYIEIMLNVEADRTEFLLKRRIMNRAHSFWSMGFFGAGLFGAALGHLGISPQLHLALVVPMVAISMALFLGGYEPAPGRFAGNGDKAPRLARPTLPILVLVAVTLSAMLLEGASIDWSAIYMRTVFDSGPFVAGFTVALFAFSQATTRFFADSFVDRHSPSGVARVLLASMAAGVLLVFLSPDPFVSMLGFALLGIGSSALFPLAISAAAQRTDRPAAINVAALSQISFVAFLLGPPLLGFVSDHWGIRSAFAIGIPFIALSLLTAGSLGRRTAAEKPAALASETSDPAQKILARAGEA